MGVCVGGGGLVCVWGRGGQASIQSIQTTNVVKWLTNKRKLPTRVTLYSYYVKLLLKMFNVRFLVCLFILLERCVLSRHFPWRFSHLYRRAVDR